MEISNFQVRISGLKLDGGAGCTSQGHSQFTLYTRKGDGVFAERR